MFPKPGHGGFRAAFFDAAPPHSIKTLGFFRERRFAPQNPQNKRPSVFIPLPPLSRGIIALIRGLFFILCGFH
jgi:hypothetical protein